MVEPQGKGLVTTMTAEWIKDLLGTSEGRKQVERERLIVDVAETLCEVMECESVTRTDLARRLKCSPAFITKLLRGTHNFTLQTLSDVFFMLGQSVHVHVQPIGESVREASGNGKRIPAKELGWIAPGRPFQSPVTVADSPDVGESSADEGIAA